MKTTNRPPQGKRGGVTRVTTQHGSFDTDKTEQHYKPEELIEGPIATVGISASVGRSTEYVREKYEISAWCSLPVSANEEGIKEGYDVAYEFVMQELERREQDVQDRFFPNTVAKK